MPRKLKEFWLSSCNKSSFNLEWGLILQPVLKIVPSFTLLFDSFFKDLLFRVFFMYISGWTWRVRLPNAAHGRRRTCKYTHAGIATCGQANSSKVERALLLSVCFKSTGRMIWCESKGNMLRKKKLLSFFFISFSLFFFALPQFSVVWHLLCNS